jgi:hypothetical protein
MTDTSKSIFATNLIISKILHKPGIMKMTKSIPIAMDFMEGSVSEYLDNLWAKKSFIVANI